MVRRGVALATVVVALLLSAGAAQAATRLVATNGVDAPNTCTVSPCQTIGHAVSVAGPGDTISIGPGTFAEAITVTKNLSFVGAGAAPPPRPRSTARRRPSSTPPRPPRPRSAPAITPSACRTCESAAA